MCFCQSLNSVGAEGFGGSASFRPTTPDAQTERTILEGPACVPGLPRGSAFPGFPGRGGGPRGLPRPLPRPSVLQRHLSSEGSCAPGSQPDGFRNRVAAVSALSQPHLCCSALGSPTAPRSEPGNPTLPGTEREPPTSWRRTPGCRSRAGEASDSAPRPVRPACPVRRRRTGCWGWGGRASTAVEMLGRWQKGCAG